MERKAFLRVLAGSVAGLAFSDPLGEFAAGGQRRIGQTEVDQVRALARLFASQDHGFAGGLSADAVVAQLNVSASLLNNQFAKESVRRQYFSAVAELADTAGGMCFDAAVPHQAERCFRFSVARATEAGDWAMRAKALSGMANLAVHQGRPDDALSMAEMALVRADQLRPVTRAVMHSRHARALGLNGAHREAECLTAVHQAEDYFARGTNDEPEWISYYSSAHLERDLGRALLHLAVNGGDPTRAEVHLTTAIAQFPHGRSRGKTLAIANLAHLTMVRGDPHEAAALGNSALDSLGPMRSDRVFESLRRLRSAGRRSQKLADVRDVNRRVDGVLRSSG